MQSDQPKKATILYIPHGGGPMPLLGDPGHAELINFLHGVSKSFPKPEAIIVISAHWEETVPTITGGDHPSLLYDYYGFPEESYHIQYPAAGQTELAETIRKTLAGKGIETRLDKQRGFDHGLFVPLKLMLPEADIPCVQISLVDGLDPAFHLRIGEALRPLLKENLLIIGSGFSFHNLRAFFNPVGDGMDSQNSAFQEWLVRTLADPGTSEGERENRLRNWSEAPFARYNHPREEHLLPLHVCYGMAQSCAEVVFDGTVIGKRAVGLKW